MTGDQIISTFALGVALVSGVVAVLAWLENRRSAQAAERSAEAAERSADSSERSERSAERAATEAERMAATDTDRRHDELGPHLPDAIRVKAGEPGTSGRTDLLGSITVHRDYRVKATKLSGNAESSISLDAVLRAGEPYPVYVDSLPPGEHELAPTQIRFRFWPATGEERSASWSCPCGRPLEEGDEGHWEVRVPVAYTPPSTPITGRIMA